MAGLLRAVVSITLVLLALVVAHAVPAPSSAARAFVDPCANARPVPAALRLPASVPAAEPMAIERTMLQYLQTYGYRELGWCRDKGVRDTGPYIAHQSYGTHPAVQIYYSRSDDVAAGGRKGVPPTAP